MAIADLTGLIYFAPILAFLIVFLILFAALRTSKILGEHIFIHLLVPFIIATIFVSFGGLKDYVLTITPWFAALVVSLFFLLMLTGFVGKPVEGMNKGIGIIFIIVMLLVFLVSGFVVFSKSISSYLPGGAEYENPEFARLRDNVLNSRMFGGILLIIVSIAVSWFLVKSVGKKS